MTNPFKERAKLEGFKNPDNPKTWTVYRYLLPEKSIWAILKKEQIK